MSKQYPSQDQLKSLLHYNPETGIFTWKARDESKFSSYRGFKVWHGRYLGKEAGYVHICERGKSYRRINIKPNIYQSHRLAWLYVHGEIPSDMEVDHINGNGCDNRICNLRLVDRSENCKNIRKSSANKSGVVGVFWVSEKRKWRSSIKINGKNIFLGYFNNINDAASARLKAEKHYGFHQNHGQERPL